MSATDAVIAAVVIAAALALLYRYTWKSGGQCAGCSGGCAPRPRGELVKLTRKKGSTGRS
jgi:hypothetical protein